MQVAPDSAQLPCMVLHCELPRTIMCHTHIFPKAKRESMLEWLGVSEVHAGWNGLLLSKSIQVCLLVATNEQYVLVNMI